MSISAFFVYWLVLQQSWQLSASQFPGLDHWRLVSKSGLVLAIDGPWQPGIAEEELVAIWHWSDVAPPRRYLPEELAKARQKGFERTAERLSFRRTGDDPGARKVEASRQASPEPPAILLAGPAELWSEVPENLLPRFFWSPSRPILEVPSKRSEEWRARLIQGTRGSYWLEIPRGAREASLTLSEAPDLAVQVVGADGEPLDDATLLVWRPGRALGLRIAARYQGSLGALFLPRLPDLEEGQYFFGARGYLTFSLRSLPSALPGRIELSPGATLVGRLVGDDDEGVAGVQLIAQTWLEDGSAGYRVSKTTSDPEGYFRFETLPPGALNLRTAESSRGSFSAELDLPKTGLDLGEIRLQAAVSLRVRVVDPAGRPIPGAKVQYEGQVFVTNEEGQARIEGIDAQQKVQLLADAPFYLTGSARFEPPHDELREIRLEGAYQVRGQFVDASGQPVSGGRNLAVCGTSRSNGTLGPSGEIDKLLPVDKACALRLYSASTPALEIKLEPGRHFEVRDLGIVRAEKTRRAFGRLVSAEDIRPVAGARLWLPRPENGQEALAQMYADFAESTSAADGSFELTGLPSAACRLRVDAAGFARLEYDLPPMPPGAHNETGDLDLGTLELTKGAAVWVLTPGLANGAMARLDRRGEWQDLDLLQATVVDEEALFPQVAAGSVLLTVLDRGKLRCEKLIVVPESGELEVECPAERLRVLGQVLLGGRPAQGGQLLFLSPGESRSMGIIHHQLAPGGQKRARISGGGRPQVDVDVAEDGSFETTDLAAGSWEVHYQRSGGVSASIRIEIPDAPEFAMDLTYPQARVAGIVVDREGKPVSGAYVRERPHGQIARTNRAGEFLFENAGPGRAAFQADFGEQRSNTVELTVPEDGDAPALELILGAEERRGEVAVQVDLDGRRAKNAWVLLETDDGRREQMATDSQGVATFNLQEPLPAKIRLAASADDRLIFGDWLELARAQKEPNILRPPACGALELPASERELPGLGDAKSWDIAFWLGRLGRRPMTDPQGPTLIECLPPGAYRLRLGGREQTLAVVAGETTPADAP